MSDEDTKYVVLAEHNGKHCETWYYFIKYNGNEESLEYLSKQLEKVEFYLVDDLSTFDLDLEHKMSETTAKEMIKLEINSFMFHRLFTGKMKKIDLGFREKDSNVKKIVKTFDILGVGSIEKFVEDEFIHPEDMVSDPENASDSDSTDYEYDISSSESEFEYEDDSEETENDNKKQSEKQSEKQSSRQDFRPKPYNKNKHR
jgi:hypothetical protein